MFSNRKCAISAVVVLLTTTYVNAQIAPERLVRPAWRVVEDTGNPADGNGKGKVNKVYRIAAHEVTNAEYTVFLNSKARLGDPLELYNISMELEPRGGILRTGSGTTLDPYIYATKLDMANKPVNFVSFFDAMRFANWFAGGQGNADTEDGTYTLLGGTTIPTNGDSVKRNPGSTAFVPRENEWYKAAHYSPGFGYYLYATQSHALPVVATATPFGDVANPGPAVVNYDSGSDWGGMNGNLTSVGSAGGTSYYGAYDMNGNVWEWNESIFTWEGSPYRVSNGGAYLDDESTLKKTSWGIAKPWVEKDSIGFRIAAAGR